MVANSCVFLQPRLKLKLGFKSPNHQSTSPIKAEPQNEHNKKAKHTPKANKQLPPSFSFPPAPPAKPSGSCHSRRLGTRRIPRSTGRQTWDPRSTRRHLSRVTLAFDRSRRWSPRRKLGSPGLSWEKMWGLGGLGGLMWDWRRFDYFCKMCWIC